MGKFLNSKFSQVSSNSVPLRRLGISTGFHTHEDMESTKYFSRKNLHLIPNYIYLPYCALSHLLFSWSCLLTTTRQHTRPPPEPNSFWLSASYFEAFLDFIMYGFMRVLSWTGISRKQNINFPEFTATSANYSNYVKGWTFVFYFLQFWLCNGNISSLCLGAFIVPTSNHLWNNVGLNKWIKIKSQHHLCHEKGLVS